MNNSRRERILNLIGLGLLTICFLLSLGRIFGRYSHPDEAAGKTSIRFAHWQLESGLRDAFDRLSAEYMRLHPDVHVEQLPVPASVYVNWLRTQLIGGTAPELIEAGMGSTNEMLSNYFEPVTPYIEQPNPYNANNDLAHTPWRNTFIDGLSHGYNQELLEYYSIPNTIHTVRMFYNRPLWRTVFGSEIPPRTFEEMLACCRRATEYRTPVGERILPMAGSQYNTPMIVTRLFANQTQRLLFSLARPGELFPTSEELVFDYLNGRWSFDTPAVRDGMQLAHDLGQYFPAGFMQLRREDALFLFSQGRVLMTITGSWDAPSIRSQAPFPVGVFDVPVPTSADPRYGSNTVGQASEAGAATALGFAITKQTSAAKRAQIIDFLHFLSSRDANREFSLYSGWLPAVVGVQPAPEVQPFVPHTDGYPPGFNMGLAVGVGDAFGPECSRAGETTMYRLFNANSSLEVAAHAISDRLHPAAVSDIKLAHRNQLELIARQDTTLAALRALDRGDPESSPAKVSELDELQTQEEIFAATRRWKLGQLGMALEK